MKPTVLVVDDIEANVVYLSEILQAQGYHVLEATSGQEAIAIVAENTPNLALLDIMMPNMSGIQLCEYLKKNPATSSVPIIFITALGDSSDIARGFEAGAVDYIVKPFNVREIILRVYTQLQIEQQRRALQDALNQLLRLQVAMNQYITKSARESIEEGIFDEDITYMQPRRKILTVMFTDIADFTTISESLDAEILISSLTLYMALLTQIIHDFGGEIDKFLGDGLLAYFEDAPSAVQAAAKIQVALHAFNQEQVENNAPRFDTRIGLATGSVLQANLGYDGRREITIMGDRVNTAARLQGRAPLQGILMDEATHIAAASPDYSDAEAYTLKGKQQSEVAYSLDYEMLLNYLKHVKA